MTDWIKFDKDDESTWPENHISVIINYNHGVVEAYHVNGDFFEYDVEWAASIATAVAIAVTNAQSIYR